MKKGGLNMQQIFTMMKEVKNNNHLGTLENALAIELKVPKRHKFKYCIVNGIIIAIDEYGEMFTMQVYEFAKKHNIN